MTTTATDLPPLALRLLEVVAAGRPEAASPQAINEREWHIGTTSQGPIALRAFDGQDNLKLRLPTRSPEGIRLAADARSRRNANLRVQSSFNSKEWLVDIRPDDDYDYLRAIAESLWIRPA
jgi:hypothetical protein